MDLFRQMQRYEAGDDNFQRRMQNRDLEPMKEYPQQQSPRNEHKSGNVKTPSKYSSVSSPFVSQAENRNNQKTLTWSSPLVYSPHVKFSPKINFDPFSNDGTANEDHYATNQRENSNTSNKYMWSTPKATNPKKNSMKFPLGDKECDQDKVFNSTASTLNTTDDISEVCTNPFMDSLGVSRPATYVRKAPSCAGDYYSQVVSQTQKELRRQAIAATQKPVNLHKPVTEKPVDKVKETPTYEAQVNDFELPPRQLPPRNFDLSESRRRYDCKCMHSYPPRPYYGSSSNLGIPPIPETRPDYSPGPMLRTLPDRRIQGPYYRPPPVYPEEPIFDLPPEIPLLEDDRMWMNRNFSPREGWMQPREVYGIDEYYTYPYERYNYDLYRPMPIPRPRHNYLLNRYLHQLPSKETFERN